MYTTYTRAAESGPAWSEAPGSAQAVADEPGLHCFHPETCRRILAIAWLLAHQSGGAGDTKSLIHCLLTHLNYSMNQLAVFPIFLIFFLKIVSGHLCRKSSGDIGHGALVGIQREWSQTTILQKQPVCLEVPVKIKQTKVKETSHRHIITFRGGVDNNSYRGK